MPADEIQRYRAKAQACRESAERSSDSRTRASYLELATTFELIADNIAFLLGPQPAPDAHASPPRT